MAHLSTSSRCMRFLFKLNVPWNRFLKVQIDSDCLSTPGTVIEIVIMCTDVDGVVCGLVLKHRPSEVGISPDASISRE